MTEQIMFQSQGLEIEGLLQEGENGRGVVITHPHPQYGGDMYNSVVTSVSRVAQTHGYTTLRFNFRGVGKSQGVFDEGKGEAMDSANAIRFLQSRGITHIDLVGYSFGAWVNVHCFMQFRPKIGRMLMVSPPIDFLPFPDALQIPELALVVSGTEDMFASGEEVERVTKIWNPSADVRVIGGADHFYSNRLGELESILVPFFHHVPGAK